MTAETNIISRLCVDHLRHVLTFLDDKSLISYRDTSKYPKAVDKKIYAILMKDSSLADKTQWDAHHRYSSKLKRNFYYLNQMEFNWAITIAIFSPDEQEIFLSFYDGSIKLLNAISRKTIFSTTSVHKSPIKAAAFSYDSKNIITGSNDAILRLWNKETWLCEKVFQAHPDSVTTAISWIPNSPCFVSGSFDGTLRLWDKTKERCIKIFEGYEKGLIKPEMPRILSLCILPNGEEMLSAFSNGVIKRWNIASGSSKDYIGHSQEVSTLSISVDGKEMLSTSMDKTVKIWNLESDTYTSIKYEVIPRDAVFSPVKRIIIVALDDGTINFLVKKTKETILKLQTHSFTFKSLKILSNSDGKIFAPSTYLLESFDFSLTYEEMLLNIIHDVWAYKEQNINNFNSLPKKIKDQIYPSWHDKKKDFFSDEDLTNENRILLIYDYLIKTSLPDIQLMFAQTTNQSVTEKLLKRFSKLPLFIRLPIYKNMFRIQAFGKEISSECGEFAFHNAKGYSATNKQRAHAISLVLGPSVEKKESY